MVWMKVLLVGHDFDFSAGDGISRYSSELYNGLRKYADVKAVSTGRLPRPMRAFLTVNAGNADIVHLMYPDVAHVNKENAKMLITWHDLRLFSKYSSKSQYRQKPKLTERFNIANSVIKNWGFENYAASDAALFNSSQTMKELKDYFTALNSYDPKKLCKITPLGVEKVFLKTKVWNGDRKDFAYIGSIHLKHKNLQGLLRAFDKVARVTDSMLHIYTSSPNAEVLLKDHLKEFGGVTRKRVVLHLQSSDEEIASRLPRLAAYLQLTKHEGLGMPILEALASGTNVITLIDSTIPEETRRYSIRVSENEVSKAMLSLVKNPRPAPRGAINYARRFTWERTVKETLKTYKKVLSR